MRHQDSFLGSDTPHYHGTLSTSTPRDDPYWTKVDLQIKVIEARLDRQKALNSQLVTN